MPSLASGISMKMILDFEKVQNAVVLDAFFILYTCRFPLCLSGSYFHVWTYPGREVGNCNCGNKLVKLLFISLEYIFFYIENVLCFHVMQQVGLK